MVHPCVLTVNIFVTILTLILIVFGIHNLYYFYKGLAEYNSTIGFYIFSLATLVFNLANDWIDINDWPTLKW